MKKLVSTVALSAMLFANVAYSASLSDMTGKVLINKGKGFSAAVAGQELKAGDKVMVGENSFAVLNYDSCAVSLDKPTVMTVAKTPVCGDAGVFITPTAGSDDDTAVPLPWPLLLLLIGGGAAAVTVIAVTSDNKNCPASGPC